MENLIEKIIKVLMMDNGGEFCINEFKELCNKCGIERQKTNPYTHQHNGVIERMNRMLMEKERCMFSFSRLGHEFLEETVGSAWYLINNHPQKLWMESLHMRYGLVGNPL